MQVKKVVQCKIQDLTNIKEQILSDEYNDYQNLCQEVSQCVDNDYIPDKPYFLFKNPHRYSATVWGAIQTITKKPQFAKMGEQPLYLRNDVSRIEKQPTKKFKYWLKIPTKQRKQFWVAVNIPECYQNKMDDYKFCDSKIVKKGNEWFAHITIKKDIMLKTDYKDILGIDLGIRRPASVVQLSNGVTGYYGKEIRQLRGHYFHLRKKLGEKKAFKTIEKIGDTEKRKVRDQLHKISRKIVNHAKATDSLIVLGDLTHIRKSGKHKGRKFNRKLSSMPFAKLSDYITYKANWEGIQVIKVNEAYTSQTCSECGLKGMRMRGLFKCSCGYQDNADRNGAINIAKRGLGEMSSSGASITDQAHNFRSVAT